ncbi:MAG: DegV family protein [Candidatus Thorarchaeota archaeon]
MDSKEYTKYSAHCPLCNRAIEFQLSDLELEANKKGEFALIKLPSHGLPPHGLKVYIDSEKNIRSSYPTIVENNSFLADRDLKYNHIVDGSADISVEDGKNIGLEVIPYQMVIEGKIKRKYLTEINQNDVINLILNEQKIDCESITVDDYLDTLIKCDNQKPIIINTISSQINKNYVNALKAKKTIEKVNPSLAQNIIINDTNAICPILKIIATYSIELDKKGYLLNQILEFINWLKFSHRTYLIAESLDCLKRNNIIGALASFSESVKGTRPLLVGNVEGQGRIEPYKSIKSTKEGLGEIIRLIKKEFRGKELTGVIYHSMAESAAIKLLEYLEIMLEIRKEDFLVEPVGSTLCIQGGVGLLGLSVYPKN